MGRNSPTCELQNSILDEKKAHFKGNTCRFVGITYYNAGNLGTCLYHSLAAMQPLTTQSSPKTSSGCSAK